LPKGDLTEDRPRNKLCSLKPAALSQLPASKEQSDVASKWNWPCDSCPRSIAERKQRTTVPGARANKLLPLQKKLYYNNREEVLL